MENYPAAINFSEVIFVEVIPQNPALKTYEWQNPPEYFRTVLDGKDFRINVKKRLHPTETDFVVWAEGITYHYIAECIRASHSPTQGLILTAKLLKNAIK